MMRQGQEAEFVCHFCGVILPYSSPLDLPIDCRLRDYPCPCCGRVNYPRQSPVEASSCICCGGLVEDGAALCPGCRWELGGLHP
jgi:hypothetical protein